MSMMNTVNRVLGPNTRSPQRWALVAPAVRSPPSSGQVRNPALAYCRMGRMASVTSAVSSASSRPAVSSISRLYPVSSLVSVRPALSAPAVIGP